MPDEERTEAASPKRRQEARERGNIPRSIDLSSSAVLVVAIYILGSRIESITEQFMSLTERFISEAGKAEVTTRWVMNSFSYSGLMVVQMLAPLFGIILITAVVVSVAQSGLPSSLKPLIPDFSKLNPLHGFTRMFSMRGVVELLKSMMKLVLLGWLGWAYVNSLLLHPAASVQSNTNSLFALFLSSADSISKRLAMVLLLIGLADYGYQRFQYEKNLRMTAEEVKQELKETEGNPQIKSRIRQRMRAIANRRMMQRVPEAQVVITNPTHYAIALKYVPPMQAPKVVAKGADLIALKIREVATEANVPIVSNPPLAQALYKSVELDQEIPADLYQAVAEVLAYIHRLRQGAGISVGM